MYTRHRGHYITDSPGDIGGGHLSPDLYDVCVFLVAEYSLGTDILTGILSKKNSTSVSCVKTIV